MRAGMFSPRARLSIRFRRTRMTSAEPSLQRLPASPTTVLSSLSTIGRSH